jgi:hypothetical protein
MTCESTLAHDGYQDYENFHRPRKVERTRAKQWKRRTELVSKMLLASQIVRLTKLIMTAGAISHAVRWTFIPVSSSCSVISRRVN